MIKPGLYKDISNYTYHASSALSRSDIMKFIKSPYHFNNRHLTPFKETEAMNLGSLVHSLILEPHLVEKEYFFYKKIDKRTKKGKIDYNDMLASSKGMVSINEETAKTAYEMRTAVKSNSYACELLEGCLIEPSIFWRNDKSGLELKSRPDAMKDDGDNKVMVVDLKTTKDASQHKFQRSCIDFGYFHQAATASLALESTGKEMTHFMIIAVENTAPFATAIYEISSDTIKKVCNELKGIYLEISNCKKNDAWPSYGFNTLSIPNYMLTKQNKESEKDAAINF